MPENETTRTETPPTDSAQPSQEQAPRGPAPQEAGTQTDRPTASPGQRLVSDDEYQRLVRAEQNYRGAAPLINTLVSNGIKDPDGVSELLSLREKAGRLSERGLSVDQIVDVFSQREDTQTQSGPVTPEELNRILDERDQKTARRTALGTHKEAERREGSLIQQTVDRIAGSEASEGRKRAVARIVRDHAEQQRSLYPDGHPLRDDTLRPLSDEQIKAVEDAARREWVEDLGQTLAQIGDAASDTQTATAQPGGPGGPVERTNTNDRIRRRPMAEKRDMAAKILRKYEGGTISTA